MQDQIRFRGSLTAVAAFAIISCHGGLTAQAASSRNHFVVAAELANGAVGNSSTYKLCVAVGNGVVPPRTRSTNFVLVGGYAATLGPARASRPWLSGVLPRFATPRSAAVLSLHGADLNVGPTPSVRVGNVAATMLTRARDRITVRMGFQPVPGWQAVSVSNSSGTTTVGKGIGILPMLMTEPAPTPNKAFEIVFKGSQNDMVIWALSGFTGPPVGWPGFLYGLALNPAALIMMPGIAITSPSGESRLPIPATPYMGPAYAQAAFSTTNPGYGPASFSNVLTF